MTKPPTAPELRKRIEELYAKGIALGEDGTTHQILPMSVTPDRGVFLRDVCKAEGAKSALEIGLAYGMSTLLIQESLLENGADLGSHTVIDPHQHSTFHGAGLRALKEAGVEPFIEFHENYSELVLPRLLSEGRVFDFVFIDGLHRFDQVFVDLFYAHRLLKPSGMVVLDDGFADSVHFACRYVQANYGYLLAAQHPSHSSPLDDDSPSAWRAMMVALRKPEKEVLRDRFHFVAFFPTAAPPLRPDAAAVAGDEPLPAGNVAQPQESVPPKSPASGVRASILRHSAKLALQDGDRAAARRNLFEALRLEPFHLKVYLRLIKTFLPRPMVRMLSGSPHREVIDIGPDQSKPPH